MRRREKRRARARKALTKERRAAEVKEAVLAGVQAPLTPAQLRQEMLGRFREGLVREALEWLFQQGCILGYRMTLPRGDEDMAGVDAMLTKLDGTQVRFQIKGHQKLVRQHYRHHPDIPCISVYRLRSTDKVVALLQETFTLPRLRKLWDEQRKEDP